MVDILSRSVLDIRYRTSALLLLPTQQLIDHHEAASNQHHNDRPTKITLGLKQIADEKFEMAFATGAAGSGKSTALATILNEVNARRPFHVVTLEDPVEFTCGFLFLAVSGCRFARPNPRMLSY